MMTLFLILGLIPLSGAKGEDVSCETPQPECLYNDPFLREADIAHQRSGDFLPSNEFFQKTCNYTVELLLCSRDYIKNCLHGPLDVDALIHVAVEMCDEDSDLRKGYADHVSCVNSIDFISTCLSFFKMADKLSSGAYKVLHGKNIAVECLVLYVTKPCIIEAVQETCGTEAAQTATDVFDRAGNVFSCSEDNESFFDELKTNMTSNSTVY